MVDSPEFHAVIKEKFNLSELGFWWIHPKAENAGKYTQTKFYSHHKLDRSDIDKNDSIIAFFNNCGIDLDDNCFGTPMSVVPLCNSFLDDQLKSRIDGHVGKQVSVGNSIQSETISGVQALN